MSIYPTPCPVDGCERGPFEDEGSLRGHVNASAGEGHDWGAVKEGLATNEEGGKAGDGAGTDDQPEEGDEQADTPEEGDEGSETPAPQGDDTSEDDTEMPTQEEYEQQHGGGEGAESGDGDNDTDTDDGGSDTSGSPLAALPMDPLTLGMLLAAALGIWLMYRAVSGSEGNDQPTTSGEGGKAGDGPATDDQPPAGGLTG